MNKLRALLLGVAVIPFTAAFGQSDTLVLRNGLDSLCYAIGVSAGNSINSSLNRLRIDDFNKKIFFYSFVRAVNGDSVKFEPAKLNSIITNYLTARETERGAKNLTEGRAFLEKNKSVKGVVSLPSGLQYTILTQGAGALPKSTDTVTVHYEGKLLDGRIFDSSVKRGEPIVFPLGGLIPGWVEALQLMPVGSKWRLFIPSELAYGTAAPPGSIIEPNMVLIFDVELLGINQKK
jgi:FKBP-type peptidyl-prolyl cis-trans isomerase FklB